MMYPIPTGFPLRQDTLEYFPSLAIALGVAWVGWRLGKRDSPWAPSAFYFRASGLFLALPLIAAPDYSVWPGAVAIFALAGGAIAAGETLAHRLPSPFAGSGPSGSQGHPPPAPFLKWLCLACGALGVLAVCSVFRSSPFEWTQLISLDQWRAIQSHFTKMRYDDIPHSSMVRLLSLGIYLGALLSGLLWTQGRDVKDRWPCAAPLAAAFLFAVMEGARARLLVPLVLWFAAWAASRRRNPPQDAAAVSVPRRTNLFIPVMIVSTLGISILIQWVGFTFSDHAHPWLQFLNPVRVRLFGHLSAFSYWFRHSWNTRLDHTYGSMTFAGVFDLLRIKHRLVGLYAQNVSMSDGQWLVYTNVFTVMRGLIEDFGVVGSLALLTAVGFFAARSFHSLSNGRLSHVPILAAYYAFVLWGPVASLAAYNVVPLSLTLFWGYCLWAEHRFGQSFKKHLI
jgi:oligosaccharide repeat unit polymerase